MFRVEAEEHLDAIERSLLALEQTPTADDAREELESTFRAMHTLKGAARSVNLREIEEVCHGCEAVLSQLARGRIALTGSMLECLRDSAKGIAKLVTEGPQAVAWPELVGRLKRAGEDAAPSEADHRAEPAVAPPEPAGTSAEPAVPRAKSAAISAETIRIKAARLDRLILQSEELLVPKLAAEERVKEARLLLDQVQRCRNALKGGGTNGQGIGLSQAPLHDGEAMLRELATSANRMLSELERDRRTIYAAVDNFVDEMRQVRMIPVSMVLDIFPRMVRDLAAAAGKEVRCVVEGGELEVDRKVLEAMKDPLIHLVRNAVDHGIEAPAVRRTLGKALPAQILLTVVAREDHRIEITVSDDGSGIDLSRVRDAAVRQRMGSSDAIERMGDSDALELIYRSGLSTSPIVTDISGHGLGLAIVAERVEQLDGQISIESHPGKGTRFRITLPASIATFRGLLVKAAGQSFLVPADAVEAALRVQKDAMGVVAGRDFVQFKEQPVPTIGLADALGLDDGNEHGDAPLGRFHVVINADGQRAALVVDEILGDREVLLKALGFPLVRVRNIAVAGLLGTGELVLVLRPADLYKSLKLRERGQTIRKPRQAMRRQPTILVVDDSITTRTMEKNLFEAMGYRVRVATDGVDAWTMLAGENVDIVVSDVDMPRMNGFDLTARIRADRRLGNLPVVLVTALDSREDKEQGIRVGANAYVIKSSLDKTNLQQIIERLL
ncbi:MAG: two-component system, chemotaxis family, sensor kinase CheA [Rhodospirillaceae bacterium]|nr:two-component system, chemotaxis family, sensor kinase CheA [Rhodospirillaceae bacterium]